MLNTSFLFASLLWGSVGLGYFIYGKKQQLGIPMAGGVVMMAASYFAASVLVMSLICVGVMGLVYVLSKRFG